MYTVDKKKWYTFPPNVQVQNIAAELSRAAHAALYVKKESRQRMRGAYERALALIDASIADPQWEDKKLLYQLRDAVAALYTGSPDPAIVRFIYTQLLSDSW